MNNKISVFRASCCIFIHFFSFIIILFYNYSSVNVLINDNNIKYNIDYQGISKFSKFEIMIRSVGGGSTKLVV